MTDEIKKFHNKFRIESTRLKRWDYSSDGMYFVTVCTKNREHFFGDIVNGMSLDMEQIKICKSCWLDLPGHYPNCVLDAFVVMPNHVHGVIMIDNNVETGLAETVETGLAETVETGFKPVSTKNLRYSLSEIIRGFKTFTARKINDYQKTEGQPFWQARFYDRIIRNEEELNRIREYIQNNPAQWENDRNNLENIFM